jgi:hypothetical protein
MNFTSNKIKPQHVQQNFEPTGPLATKAKLDPAFLDLMGNIKEKKIDKSGKMRMAD